MPIYEYVCMQCESHFEELVRGDQQVACPDCSATNVSRQFSTFAVRKSPPELNAQENIWQFMRQNWLSNRIFTGFDNIVDLCCDAWNRLTDQPWKIMSIAYRQWTVIGQAL